MNEPTSPIVFKALNDWNSYGREDKENLERVNAMLSAVVMVEDLRVSSTPFKMSLRTNAL